jgi:hypothetical protein
MTAANRQTETISPPAGPAAFPGGSVATGEAGLSLTPNRCCRCGRFCGEKWTGYDRDRASDRGRLFCDRCVLKMEAGR